MEQKYKIHAFYILAILIAIIVILVTVKWSQVPNLSQLITFALTLSSLILAVLAIGYAVHSNTSFLQTTWKLNDATRGISDTAKEISVAANDLTVKIAAIPSRLESMEAKVEQTHVLLQSYSERQEIKPPSEEEKRAVSEIVNLFVKRVPPNGLLILYAYSLSYSKRIPFDPEELFSSLENIGGEYALGFIVATKCTGLVSTTYVSRRIDNLLTSVTYMDPNLPQSIENELKRRLNDRPEELSEAESESIKNSMQTKKDQVDRCFQKYL
jgi:hypothetical protein